MSAAATLLLRDWPLKLAALLLATVLYLGVALAENVRTFEGPVPIDVLRPPTGGALLDAPGSVTQIRFRAPLDVAGRLTSDSFRASVDLSSVVPAVGADPVAVAVDLFALNPRVEVVDYTPTSVNVRVDKVVSRGMPVRVDHGVVPDGFEVGPTEVDPARVLVRGAGTRVALVTSVGARVPIDASGLNVDQDVLLEAVDDSGAIVDGVQIEPATARVRIDVARRLSYATIPLVPRIVGQPADGQVIGSVSVEPLTVTVAGEEPVIRELTSVSTGPIDLTDRRDRVETTVELVLPVDVTVDGEASAVVTVELRPGATPSPHAGGRWDLLW